MEAVLTGSWSLPATREAMWKVWNSPHTESSWDTHGMCKARCRWHMQPHHGLWEKQMWKAWNGPCTGSSWDTCGMCNARC